MVISIDWITTQSLHPDDYKMTYDYEWPSTGDYAKLFAMKSFNLHEFKFYWKEVNGKKFMQGIKFIFHGEKNPITFGKCDG